MLLLLKVCWVKKQDLLQVDQAPDLPQASLLLRLSVIGIVAADVVGGRESEKEDMLEKTPYWFCRIYCVVLVTLKNVSIGTPIWSLRLCGC